MKVSFRTNLDEAKGLEWPELDFPPAVGDKVRAVHPFGKCQNFELKVVGRTFTTDGCICELHLNPNQWPNILEFEAWCLRMKY